MEVTAGTQVLRVGAGEPARVTLQVRNTSPVIDRVYVELFGLPGAVVTATPPGLSLFPQVGGELNVRIDLPRGTPAGSNRVSLLVASTLQPTQRRYVDLEVVVEAAPALTLRVTPERVRTRRQATFVAVTTNEGNTTLDVSLAAADAERHVTTRVPAEPTRLLPGRTSTWTFTARGPRLLTGGDTDRALVVMASAGPETQVTAVTTLRQRPLVARGALTALVLVGIVALWAGAFALGITKVFTTDALTKTAPASFFRTTTGAVSLVADVTSSGALPKDGPLPAGVGGTVSGHVLATNTQQGVGRVVVEARRQRTDGTSVVTTSAATASDGSYTLLGLVPGSDYVLRFTSDGYTDAYDGGATSEATATRLRFGAQEVRTGVDVLISGLPASISGSVDTGDALHPVPVTVTARSLLGPHPGSAVATVTSGADGTFTLPGLPSPDSYQLGFTAAGYEVGTTTDEVAGGVQRKDPAVTLLAQDGSISGTVCSGPVTATSCAGLPGLGAVTVSTVLNGTTVTTATPTQGAVGRYRIGGLATPGTYVVTFTLPGFGAQTQVVQLAPQQQALLDVPLASGSGSVSGLVVRPGAAGGSPVALGGVAVTVGGSTAPLGTTTLTAGTTVGRFAVSGLSVPGSYTLTFALAGYSSASIPVTLTSAQPSPALPTVTLVPSTGTLVGSVTSASGTRVPGATVSLTDGTTVRSTTSVSGTSPSDPASGTYRFGALPAGTSSDGTAYTLTVSAPGFATQTLVVQVLQNAATTQDVHLVAAS